MSELLGGINLDVLVERFGPLPEGRVVHILRQACASLAEAHRRNLVHRDVKPANIMICENALTHDFVKVLDFGLARRAAGEQDGSVASLDLTGGEGFLGTPAYAAPEVIGASDQIDARADLYSLACVAFWLLTGQPVFTGPTAVATLVAHTNAAPEPPSRFAPGSVSAGLDSLILRCLEKSPEARPESAEKLAESLEELALQSPWSQSAARDWWSQYSSS